MFKAVLSELKELFSTPWKIASYVLLLFVPLVYGGFFLSGFWAPINNINKLDIKIVNLDNNKNGISEKMAENLSKTNIKIRAGTKEYNMKLHLSNIYKNEGEVENSVNSGKIDAAFTIPKNFESNMSNSLVKNFPTLMENMSKDPNFLSALNNYDITKPNKIPLPILISIVSNMPDLNLPKLSFYNSYKNNFLTGELTNLVANTDSLKRAILNNMFNDISQTSNPLIQTIIDEINLKLKNIVLPIGGLLKIDDLVRSFFKYLGTQAAADNAALQDAIAGFIDHQVIGENIDTYGKGVSPYFFSIAIWAGMLVAVFILKNRRTKDQRKNNTFLNYFSKTLIWVGTSWIQVTLLWLFVVLFWGQNSGYDAKLFFSTYAYMLFIGLLFALIVQAIAFSFRLGELGSLFVVILLITQLVSSSGTFPVEMQNIIFRLFHYIAPFTYSIDTFREILSNPNIIKILELQWPILLFLLLMPLSLGLNYYYDKKYYKKYKKYNSYVLKEEEE